MFAVLLMVTSAVALGASGKGKPARFTAEETAFMDSLDNEYAMAVTEYLVGGGRVVAGTEKALRTAEWIKGQMVTECGLDPAMVYLESFPLVGWDIDELTAGYSVGRTLLEIDIGGVWVEIPAAQCSKGDGTGPDGVTTAVVDVGDGKLNDFEKLAPGELEGKVVLFTRTDLMFYCTPVLFMAAERGAVGAICHFPKTPDSELKIDISDEALPLVYITDDDAAAIRGMLEVGPVTCHYVVDNQYQELPLSTGHNVIGMIRGSELPEEYVYVGAHFDHWFTSAADDNAGIGSMLSMIKAFKDSGLQPRRTMVFAAFDSEELGGWQDTWYDWCMGSYSHIVETLDGQVLNGDRPGKIVAMFNMDVIGTEGAIVYVESTPDLTKFVKKAAFDSGLIATAPMTYVYWPPSSYDDWPFYMAGVPCTETAWWGEEYDKLYHTTGDTMVSLNEAYVRVNTVFNGLMAMRMAQASVLPYDLPENAEVVQTGLESLFAVDPEARTMSDLSLLQGGLDAYVSEIDRLSRLADRGTVDPDLLNRKMMESALELNAAMFDWDLTAWIPGWTGIFVLNNPATDLYNMKGAISALRASDGETALDLLTDVTTMKWGRFVDYEAYLGVMDYIYYVPEDHLLWGGGFLPPHSDVHQEYFSIADKVGSGSMDFSAEITSLEQLVAELYGAIDVIADELGLALYAAAGVLSEAR
ncbi:MAG: M28 family peptidase [Candidatus Thermoplasmatota archaeon]